MAEPTPIYIHAASRTPSFGYKPEHGYSPAEISRTLSRLLSVPAMDILQSIPVHIDAIFVSNQFSDSDGAEELVVNRLVDSLSWHDRRNNADLRLSGVTCARVETATNGLTALKVAIDHLKAGSGDTVMVIGGEKLTPRGFSDKEYFDEHFGSWAEGIINRIVSALAPNDRAHCRSMPAAMGLILNCYARTRWIDYSDLTRLIEQLAIKSYENVLNNRNAFQRYSKLFSGRSIRAVLKDEEKNPMLVYPLRQLHMSPFNDGAGALLISRHHKLQTLDGGTSVADVAISGCAIAQDTLSLTERNSLDSFPATALAAKRAYDEAKLDLRRWESELAPLIVEQHDAFVPLTLINLEDLQLFHNQWDVISFLEDKYLNANSCPLMLNPSGGLLEGHPFAGTAIIKLAECFARLAARHKVASWFTPNAAGNEKPTTAIVQSFGGIGGNVGVAVLDACSAVTGVPTRSPGYTGHYNNLGSRLEPVKASLSQDWQIVSLVRAKMPYISKREQFTLPTGETVLALVQTPNGRKYAHAIPGTDEAALRPEDICDEDIFVRLDEADDTLSFSIRDRRQRKRISFRHVTV